MSFQSHALAVIRELAEDRDYITSDPIWRFMAKIRVGANGCWIWMGSVGNGDGRYGSFYFDGRSVMSHRWIYEWAFGPIPEGLTIDHLCKNHKCQNPSHMEPVTQRVNDLRSDSITAQNARKTHCVRGHVFDEANTRYGKNGGRWCRACDRIRAASYRQRDREAIYV